MRQDVSGWTTRLTDDLIAENTKAASGEISHWPISSTICGRATRTGLCACRVTGV